MNIPDFSIDAKEFCERHELPAFRIPTIKLAMEVGAGRMTSVIATELKTTLEELKTARMIGNKSNNEPPQIQHR